MHVGLSCNYWFIEKKGFYLLPISKRKLIDENLKVVQKVILWDDSNKSACGPITYMLSMLDKNKKLIFANGGDRKLNNIPEF